MQIKGNYDISIEVTTIHPYFPRTNEISRIIMDLEINLGNYYHAYIYSDSDNKPIIRVIFKEKCDAHCSILCLRQQMSIYRISIISKIEDKSHQSENYPAYIIVLDFRTTHFDEVSLSMEIAEILQSIGEQYPSLMGIIFAIPRKTETDISVELMYYFVSNPFLQSKNSALNKLKNINAPL